MKTYTIGQIADILKGTNKRAKSTDSTHYIRHINGAIHFTTVDGDPGERVPLSDWVLYKKWELLPEYVTFNEAIKAFQEGKKIASFLRGEHYDTYIPGKENDGIHIDEILKGEWLIEEFE